MKLKDWLKTNRTFFGDTDLRFLMKDILGRSSFPILEEDTHLGSERLGHLENIKKSYIQGIPLAYILGKEEFFGLEFKVDKNVLIPRKETELIVEKAVNLINENKLCYVLDLCCGCGNIAVSLKKKALGKISIFASDIDIGALRVAKINAQKHKIDIKLVKADLFNKFKHNKFDLIVTNPPYVENKNIKGSLLYEPRLALSADNDGLYFINKILKQAPNYLKKNGYLVMEMGYNHKDAVNDLIRSINSYKIIEWIKDYSGHWRGIILEKRSN